MMQFAVYDNLATCRLHSAPIVYIGVRKHCLNMDTVTPVLRDSNLYRYKGFCFFKELMEKEFVDSLQDFKIRDDDVFMITFPKSGTIWMQQILSLIYSEGHRNGTEQIETSERVPWIDFSSLKKDVNYDHDSRPSPRLFASHLPNLFVPEGLTKKKAKVIYVMRNPKDVMKSLYHFEAIAVYAQKSPDFDHFFEKFLAGDGKVLDDESLDIVVNRATFNKMQKDPLANKENESEDFFNLHIGKFMRKGTVGDWKNIFTVAQSEAFDKIFLEKMGDLPVNFTWDITEE
ncbi:amine sulfotransferase-like isoform X3 [Mixophyes fleayi]|uniref:amine sulfotransferase-like isoform X3 n=1 Tax=Mixophyes fleayi TaxID=3061075 RepID=UPI003F4DDB8B